MKKASEYRRHAAECRQLMRTVADDEQKAALEKMASTWDSLAADRERRIEQMKRIAAIEASVAGSEDNGS
jgi:truncated hemoglobin YjbI